MRKICLAFSLIISLTGFPQKVDKTYNQDSEDARLAKIRIRIDSQNKANEAFWQHQQYVVDSVKNAIEINKMTQNMESLSVVMNERQQKARKQALIRFACAGILIVIGIIGFAIRKKKQQNIVT